jgi:hypothetical protein
MPYDVGMSKTLALFFLIVALFVGACYCLKTFHKTTANRNAALQEVMGAF